jgi:sulfoxide reductase heme-binding subunit YedZ
MSELAWYTARAGGLVAFGLLTVCVLLGIAMSGRVRLARWPQFAVEDVHRFAGLLIGAFIVLHGAALFVDSYLPFSLTQLLVPGTAAYRPLPVALGIVAAELVAALAVTNHYRRALPYRFWRRAHYVNFAVWALALVHGIASGTDSAATWALALYAACAGSVAGATVWRALKAQRLEAWAVRLWPGTAALLGAELILALALGPLHHHSA